MSVVRSGLGVGFLALLILLWELATRLSGAKAALFPPPSALISSAMITRTKPIPRLICMPAKICGSAAGSMILRRIDAVPIPNVRAVST